MHRKFLYTLYVTCWCLSSFIIAGCAGKKDVAGAPFGQPVIMADQAHGQPSPPPGMRLGMGYMSALNEPCYELYADNEDIPQAQALCYRQGGWVAVPGIYMAVPRGITPFSQHAALASAAIQASPKGEQTTTAASAPQPKGDYAALFAQAPIKKAEPEKPKATVRFAGLDDDDSRSSRKGKNEAPKTIAVADTSSKLSPQVNVKRLEKPDTDTLVAFVPGIVQSDAPMAVMPSSKAVAAPANQMKQSSNKKLQAAELEYSLGKAPLAALPVFANSLEQSSKLAAGKATKVATLSESLLVAFAGRLADINLLSPPKPKEMPSQQPQLPSNPAATDEAGALASPQPRVSTPKKTQAVLKTSDTEAPVAVNPLVLKNQKSVSVQKATVRQKKTALKSGKKRPALGSYMDILTEDYAIVNKTTASGK